MILAAILIILFISGVVSFCIAFMALAERNTGRKWKTQEDDKIN
jgi:hypothetical protein